MANIVIFQTPSTVYIGDHLQMAETNCKQHHTLKVKLTLRPAGKHNVINQTTTYCIGKVLYRFLSAFIDFCLNPMQKEATLAILDQRINLIDRY